MKITFHGAARTVTGSCHLLELDSGFKILLDCGLYQGRDFDQRKFNEKWRFNPEDIDVLLLSHAHIDHSGRVPKLVKDGFKGPIITTHATYDLCSIMLMDSAYIQEKDAEYLNRKKKQRKLLGDVEPLYNASDVTKAMDQFIGLGYNKWYPVNENVEVLYKDAGHILGSASVTMRIKEGGKTTTFAFTGDIGRPGRPILKNPDPIPQSDYIICESTYGNKFHTGRPNEKMELLRIIKETCIENKGKLIIPAFSLGRTQELVYIMDELHCEGLLPRIPVYVDSPLAVNATDIFKVHPECFDAETHRHMIHDPDPFGFNGLTYIRKVEKSKALNDNKNPCIIISASGMVTAGRIVHHVRNNVENPRNTILIVGYCAEYTIGAQLARGEEEIKIFGKPYKVKARIEKMSSFSAHGDQKEMVDFLEPQDRNQVKKLFLVHGDLNRQEVFKEVLEKTGFKDVAIPKLGEGFELS